MSKSKLSEALSLARKPFAFKKKAKFLKENPEVLVNPKSLLKKGGKIKKK